MVSRLVLALGFLLFASVCHSAIKPTMSVNQDPVCDVYFASYSAKVALDQPLSFRTEQVITYPNNTKFVPTDNSHSAMTFKPAFEHSDIRWLQWNLLAGITQDFSWYGAATDITAVGSIAFNDSQSLVLQTETIGWRGPFYSLYIVNNDELEKAVRRHAPQYFDIAELAQLKLDILGLGTLNVFEFNNKFYVAHEQGVEQITSSGKQQVCKVGLAPVAVSPELVKLQEIANRSLMTKGVSHIFMYYGTMGNPHWNVGDNFTTALTKPWLIKVQPNGRCYNQGEINNCLKNNRVEAVLADFAKSDPWSFREVETLRHHIQGAVYVLSAYYRNELKLSFDMSLGMAQQAVYDLLAEAVSKHPLMRYGNGEYQIPADPYTLDKPKGQIPLNWFNKTELMWAAHFNDFDAVQALLNDEVEVNQVTSSDEYQPTIAKLNRSALTYAAENASLPVIKALMDNSADTSIKDSTGKDLNTYLALNPQGSLTLEQLKALTLPSISPSFKCELARTKQEKAICSSAGLSIYDDELGKAYQAAKASKGYPHLASLQRSWLKQLNSSCDMAQREQVIACMKQKYRSRIRYLRNLSAK